MNGPRSRELFQNFPSRGAHETEFTGQDARLSGYDSAMPTKWVVVSALVVILVGCNFIDDFSKFTFAAGDATVSFDGGDLDGARADGSNADDGGSLPRECRDPCVADPIFDFHSETQGVGDWDWRYLKGDRDVSGISFTELASLEYEGTSAWTDGNPPPAIIGCDESTATICAGRRERLLMVSDLPGAGGDAVLSALTPSTTTYRVVGSAEVLGGAAGGVPFELYVSRNTRTDMVERIGVPQGAMAQSFSIPVDVIAGDRLLVGVRPTWEVSEALPVAVDVRVERDLEQVPLADCLYALTFDEGRPLIDECRGVLVESFGSIAPTGSPSPNLRGALRLPLESALHSSDVSLDYSKDFTVEMWLNIESASNYGTIIYRDHSTAPRRAGGVALFINLDALENIAAYFIYIDPSGGRNPSSDPNTACAESSEPGTFLCIGSLRVPRPALGSWHHYRIVRHAAAARLSFCVDGVEVASATVPVAANLSAGGAPVIGESFSGVSVRRFDGAIDDLRIFRRAMPCDTP